MVDVLLDTIIDCAKMLPFLFLAYLLIEFVERKRSGHMQKILSVQNKVGFLGGAALGLIPQCGMSALAANLYSSRVISMGTMVAVFIATSDEAVPMLLADISMAGTILPLLAVKFATAAIAGFIIDFLINKEITKGNTGGYNGKLEECDCHDHHEEDNIFVSALKHTASIMLIIFVLTLALGTVIWLIGDDVFESVISSMGVFQIFAAALVGFIPNCAASVILTQLYISGAISFGAAVAGLCTGAGVGLIVLFRQNKNIKENLKIMGVMYLFAVAAGFAVKLAESFM